MKWMIPIAGLLALISSSTATVVEDVQSVSFLDRSVLGLSGLWSGNVRCWLCLCVLALAFMTAFSTMALSVSLYH